jgi:tetratricopeptide (TPR) repeat protein
MMIEQHYDEEVLIALLDEPKPDAHLQGCAACKSALESIRRVATALHDQTVWDERDLSEEPRRETRDALRSHAETIAAEDAAAEPWVKSLLARPASEWQGIVAAHPEWRTAGFVRRLTGAVDKINFTSPADAVELTRAAVQVAAHLNDRSDTVRKLKASTWREHAYAVFYVGRHLEASAALDECERLLKECAIADYELANSHVTRSVVYGAMERLDEALDFSRRALETFVRYGDVARACAAKAAEAAVLTRAGRYREALPIYLAVMANPIASGVSRASAAHNAAIASRELGDFAEANRLFHATINLCEEFGLESFRCTARWNFARSLTREGKCELAIEFLGRLKHEFEELGMSHAVALVCIDSAEALLSLGKNAEVEQLCHSAMRYLQEAKLTYTQPALSALAFLREAAGKKTLTVRQISDVRAFFELLPKQPGLSFARPA